jgi:hypothetical protein
VASTSTNKEPLLRDRPLHVVRRLDGTITPGLTVDPTSGTSGALLVDCTTGDGAIIESLYLIQRSAGDTTLVNLYLSTSSQILGNLGDSGTSDAWFWGQFGFGASIDPGARLEYDALPLTLAPVPHAGENVGGVPPQYRALLVPNGLALWAAVASASVVPTAPLIGAQGGWF